MDLASILTFFGIDGSGLSADDIRKQVKKAYRKQVLMHHPDRGGDPSLFHRTQDVYDAFKELGSFAAPKQLRSVASLFFIFRNYVQTVIRFTAEDLGSLVENEEELIWMLHFAERGYYAGFFHYRCDAWFVNFLPEGITLPRFYRAYALKSLPWDSEEFKRIERMYIASLIVSGRSA